MNEDGSPASEEPTVTPPAADDTPPDYSSPNDLETELTEEQEQAFVDEILGVSSAEPKVEEPAVEPPVVEEPVVTPPVVEPPVVDPPKVEEPTTLEAPKTDDLFIEVEQVTEDDLGEVTTKKVKLVYDPENPGSFIPDDFQAKNSKQLSEIMESKAEMAQLYKDRKAEYDTEIAKNDTATQQAEVIAGWDREIADLVAAGILEAPKTKEGEAGYDTDPAVLKQEAVYKYMALENAKRIDAGKPTIASFGTAFTLFEKDEANVAEAARIEQENADTKAKGALVGGGGSVSVGAGATGGYVAGSARNIWDVKIPD